MLKDKLNKSTIFQYSLLAIPLSIIGFPLYIYIPSFYTLNVNIDITLVGLIIFLARLTDVISDPYIGYLGDICLKYFKSRKPLIFLGSLILSISFYFLINPSIEYPKVWLFSFSILIYLGWSMINIPYLALSSEISSNYFHKTQLNSSREVFTLIGLIITLSLPYIFSISDDLNKTLKLLFFMFLITFIPTLIVLLRNFDLKDKVNNLSIHIKDLKEVYLNIPNLKYLQMGYFTNNLANSIPATLFIIYMQYVLNEKESIGLVLILYFLSGIIALPLWTLLSKKISKKRIWLYSMILSSSAFIFIPFLQEHDIILFIIISIISGLSLGADLAFPASIQADVVQKIKVFKIDLSCFLYGIWSMLTKLSLALSIFLCFSILGLVGFDKNNISEISILTISLLYGLAPVILKIIAMFFIRLYKEEF